MTSVLRRAAAPIAVVTALVTALTACGSGPNQVNTAVIIEGRTISVDDVQSVVDKVVKEQPAARQLAQQHKLDLVAREVVTQLIVHELVTEFAREEGVRLDPGRLAQFKAQDPLGQKLPTDGSMPPEQLVPELVNRARGLDAYAHDQLLLGELANDYLGRATARYDLVTLEDAAAAKELAEKIAATPDRASELMEAAGTEAGPAQLDQETGPTGNGVFLAAPDHTVFVLPAGQGDQGGGYQVVHVISTEVSARKPADFDPGQVDPNQLPAIGKFLLRTPAIESDIEISPRFGVWNDALLNVVPKNEADVSGYAVLPSTQP